MANISTWIPAVAVPAILAVVAFVFRNYIQSKITAGVQHTFNIRLETLRSEFQKTEETFKSELRLKELQISALRETALSGFSSRRAALDKRRLEAVERVWATVVSMTPYKLASNIMSQINYDAAAKEVPKNPNVRKAFEMFGKSVDPSKIAFGGAEAERPFISPKAWALFSAYKSILSFAALQMKTLEFGVDGTGLLKGEPINALIKAALPYYTDYVEQYGAAGYHFLLDDFEQKLLEELRKMLDGVESDTADLAKAAEILRAADKVQAEVAAQSVNV